MAAAKTKQPTPKVKHLIGKDIGLLRHQLPHSVVEVIATLGRAGFEAYVVGGGVRDRLLGLAPKDFDAVTSATPSQIKDVFGTRCRIIGRRFQLAHVYSGREMIEVATFRANPKGNGHTTDDGMIITDNVWGDMNDDFARRDFSINALYYEPIKDQVCDFCGAMDDIANKRLRLLGNAKKRIEEDPVRLLRALRFKAKLGFDFDKALAKQFHKDNWALLEQVSPHRLYDETQKMFTGGYLHALVPLLYQYGAVPFLFSYAKQSPSTLLMHVAQNTDERISEGLGANPAFFYAVLLWDNFLYHLQKLSKKLPAYEASIKAARRAIDQQRQKTAIPRFAEDFITDIWLTQPKLIAPKPADVERLVAHPRFRAAYDFLVARELTDDAQTQQMGAWWTQYQLFSDDQRKALVAQLGKGDRRKRKRGNQKTKQSSDELRQLLKLSLNANANTHRAKPLFELSTPKNQKSPQPTPTHATKKVLLDPTVKGSYSDDELLARLADEPFIPARRRHKRRG